MVHLCHIGLTDWLASLRAVSTPIGGSLMLGKRRASPLALVLLLLATSGCGSDPSLRALEKDPAVVDPSVVPVGPSDDSSGADPYASINGPYVVRLGKPVELDGSGSYARSGMLVEFAWDLDGDGGADRVTAAPTITHTYHRAFDGFVTLTVTDSDGRHTSATTHVSATSDGDEERGPTDNCPSDANPGQEDSDQDGVGDVCDASPGWTRLDQPGVSEGTG